MTATMLTPQDFKKSVVAVPPLALTASLKVAPEPNALLARHIVDGGVNILLYGGNANLYHFGLDDYADALAAMADAANMAHVITSIGPDYGKMMDQAPLVERSGLRNVMLLPTGFPSDSHGVGDGIRRIAARLGFGVIVYLKREMYVRPEVLEKLIAEGAVRFVKYAVERCDPADDPYLDSVLSAVGRDLVASGMGETPIVDHVGRRGVATFTSGAVCIAPAAAMALLDGLRAGIEVDIEPFIDFERVRASFGGIQVLHSAISASGIADMGPMMPMVSVVKERNMPEVLRVLEALRRIEDIARKARQHQSA
ncbi:dihydrodipicolinate synthase [Neorhizobium galegae]|uniref:Dihydropicolinate synthase-like protein n=1 Tax=Neorhizobium galegae bv. orientalis str. HAMBI 540 TaxID=1028800 RepID=A0A068T0I7_NEOGA|nr:dihydrodipicolinate synthase [Neorhizobium galegae]MCQ1854596.1 dihydrodipicolinate synthase family protein [Neorhizobium galegae]CDN51952.1 Dihydropicolinate synthase-like protein [Neorhizobium galegae bv. orientalis str. HAMBI 540]CDZ51518.1 Dihydropicolinate synthase [Neorhizobium galegae bv. orientalis]